MKNSRARSPRAKRGKTTGKRRGPGQAASRVSPETEGSNAPPGSPSQSPIVQMALTLANAAYCSEADSLFLRRLADNVAARESGAAIIAMIETLAGLVRFNQAERIEVIQAAMSCRAKYKLRSAVTTLSNET